MNAFTRSALAASSFLVVCALAPTTSFAAYRCDQPLRMIDQRACALAAQDPAALRRFIARTRGIWDLVFEDYVR